MVPEDWPSAAADRLRIKIASQRAGLRGAVRRSDMHHLSEAARRSAGPQDSRFERGRSVRAWARLDRYWAAWMVIWPAPMSRPMGVKVVVLPSASTMSIHQSNMPVALSAGIMKGPRKKYAPGGVPSVTGG